MRVAAQRQSPVRQGTPATPRAKLRILVVGVIRDQAARLLGNLRIIDDALRDYPERMWLVVESDSDDDTPARLAEAQSHFPRFRYLSLGRLRDRLPSRTARIAHCRNTYLEEIRSRPEYSDLDYVVVADLDGVCDAISAPAIASCFTREDWAVCTANQAGPYYDLYALRHRLWCPGDWWEQYEFARSLGLSHAAAEDCSRYPRMITIPASADWIEVESAFGGLAVYRSACILDTTARYLGEDGQGNGICEHVPFHQHLRALGYKVCVNPQLINAGYTEHSRVLLGWRRLAHHISSALAIVVRRFVGR